eukprot:scaffold80656_cov63-Phaeocystis_antarctica.AAC.2
MLKAGSRLIGWSRAADYHPCPRGARRRTAVPPSGRSRRVGCCSRRRVPTYPTGGGGGGGASSPAPCWLAPRSCRILCCSLSVCLSVWAVASSSAHPSARASFKSPTERWYAIDTARLGSRLALGIRSVTSVAFGVLPAPLDCDAACSSHRTLSRTLSSRTLSSAAAAASALTRRWLAAAPASRSRWLAIGGGGGRGPACSAALLALRALAGSGSDDGPPTTEEE